MAERLAGGNVALALLANTIATGAGLVALILTFGGISGAHFNPAVTVADASQGGLPWRDVAPYIAAQVVGAFAGVALAHLMFDAPLFTASRHVRSGLGQLAGEFTATFGLISVIWGCSRSRASMTPFAVAAYITAAYWFTSSTSFANPAVTLARAGVRYICRDSTGRCPGVHRRADAGSGQRDAAFSMAGTRPSPGCRSRSHHCGRGDRTASMKTYVFACVHNAGRSQMAAAWLRQLANPGKARAVSAGTQPGAKVHPEVLEAMREVGVDLSAAVPQRLTDDLAREANMLITMGCGEACPFVPGLRREDWPLEDPKGKPVERVREIRDEVRSRIEDSDPARAADVRERARRTGRGRDAAERRSCSPSFRR